MSIYGDSISLNEGLFNRKKKQDNQTNKEEQPKINYNQRAENFINSPKTIPYEPKSGDAEGCLYGIIFGLLVTKYNYNDSKFLSLIKNNIDNFKSISLNDDGCFEGDDYYIDEGQTEYIQKLFGKINKIYLIAIGVDESIWYCKEKNKLFHIDYKHVYNWFNINNYKEWPDEYMNEGE